jgi:hypothetical protein
MKTEFFTESFDQFASRVTTTDLALYAGAGLILWILFKDKLSPVQKMVADAINKIKLPKTDVSNPLTLNSSILTPVKPSSEDIFFDLVASWKQTRDLAIKGGCDDAVKVADEMFPYLSPNGCVKKNGVKL